MKHYVINLDHRVDRFTDFIDNLQKVGMNFSTFTRISAILDDNFGGIGCAKSHLIALTDFLARSNDKYCVILEDDFRFRINELDLNLLIDDTLKIDPFFKVFLLAGTEVISFNTIGAITQIFESQSTCGYIVNRDYVGQLINNMIRSILMMEKLRVINQRELIYKRFSIDQTWKKLQQEGGWYATIPMVGFQTESFSDIEKKYVDHSFYSE